MGSPGSSVGKESACNARDPSSIPVSGRSAGEGIGYPLQYSWAFLVAQFVKNHLQCGRPGFDPWVGKIPWRRERLPTSVFWPGEFHGLYSPWGHRVRHDWVTFTTLCSRIFPFGSLSMIPLSGFFSIFSPLPKFRPLIPSSSSIAIAE